MKHPYIVFTFINYIISWRELILYLNMNLSIYVWFIFSSFNTSTWLNFNVDKTAQQKKTKEKNFQTVNNLMRRMLLVVVISSILYFFFIFFTTIVVISPQRIFSSTTFWRKFIQRHQKNSGVKLLSFPPRRLQRWNFCSIRIGAKAKLSGWFRRLWALPRRKTFPTEHQTSEFHEVYILSRLLPLLFHFPSRSFSFHLLSLLHSLIQMGFSRYLMLRSTS